MQEKNEKTPVRLVFYDPPMCCSSGLCGPNVDDKLVQLQADIETLKALYPNLIIERYMISQQPLKFRENPAVYQLVRETGKQMLPITTINGIVVKTGQYPELAEMKQGIEGVAVEN